MKKTIILTVVVILIGSVAAWFAFFNGASTPVGKTIKNILPFGSGGDGSVTEADKDNPIEIKATTDNPENLPRLFRLSDVPVAGAVSFLKNGSEVVRFADRATGHIYDINPVTLEKIKITNNTVPKVYEAYFKKDGSGVIYRSIKNNSDEITNTSISLSPPKATSTNELYTEVQTIMRGDIGSLAVSDGGKIAYNLKDNPSVVVADFNGANPKTVLGIPFSEWNISWTGANPTLTTKSSSAIDGYSYDLNISTGSLQKLLGPVNGLTALRNPLGKKIVYSTSANGAVQAYYKNLDTGETNEISSIIVSGKCVWGKKNPSTVYCGSPENLSSGGEPDLWYQGVTHYVDQVWRFNTDTGIADTIAEPKKDFNTEMDIINPILSPDEDYLIFTNKNDFSLWALKLP